MKQTCPRRIDDGMDRSDSPFRGAGEHLDVWRSLRPLGGGERVAPADQRSCSYCGSLHPDDFMAAVERGDVIGPTDKSYKAYVGKAYTPDEVQQYNERVPGGAALDASVLAHDYAKFYFQHLTEEQRRQFIELLNDKRVTVGYPGHFYVLPFFTRRVDA